MSKKSRSGAGGGTGGSKDLKKSLRIINNASKKGVIDMRSMSGIGTTPEERGKIVEALDKAYPTLNGFSVRRFRTGEKDETGKKPITHYQMTMILPDGTKYVGARLRYELPKSESVNVNRDTLLRAHEKLQMYGQSGLVRDRDGKVAPPWGGYYLSRANYDAAVKAGWDIPPGIRQYWREQDRKS